MDLAKLQKNIRQTLSEAKLIETALPLIPDILLYLIDPFNLHRMFSTDETRKIIRNAPYWSFCWASGQALGAYIVKQKELIRGRKILDFGSGSGVVAIASARAGADQVIACDSDYHAIEAIKSNANLNRVAIETIRSLNELDGKVDMILVSDLLYDSDNFSFLDILFDYTDEILLADSRIKNLQHPRYQEIDNIKAETIPDLKEGAEFNHVRIYKGS